MPKPSVDDSVSLFPFLSILACIIGILVLMITAIALGQIGRDGPSAGADAEAARKAAEEAQIRAEQFRAARQRLQVDRERLPQLQRQVEQQTALQTQRDALQKELTALESQSKNADETHRQAQQELLKHQAELERLTQQIAQLEQQLKPLRAQQTQLKSELAKRTAPPEDPQVMIQPSGSGADLNPTFVECAAASVVLLDGPEPVRIATAELAGSEPYRKLLDKVKQTDKGTLIFLIRPDGVGTYNAARHLARTSYVTNGKLAIGGQGQIDLSRFRK